MLYFPAGHCGQPTSQKTVTYNSVYIPDYGPLQPVPPTLSNYLGQEGGAGGPEGSATNRGGKVK